MAKLTMTQWAAIIEEVSGIESEMEMEQYVKKFEKDTDPEQCPDCGVWGCSCYTEDK